MRILHTSDWHVGRTIRGRSRADEHRAVLTEIATVARSEEVDLVLVAGDLFDSAAPTPESERIVWSALLALAEVADVALVAGNHDNPSRLAAVKPLLDLTNVHVRAFPAPADQGGVLQLRTRAGQEAVVALLPFLSQRSIVKADELMTMDAAQHVGRYTERCRRIVAQLTAPFRPGAVNIVLTHLTVVGGTLGGGERAAHTVFDYFVPPQVFPPTAHYVALGHLHRAQQIPGPCPIWYCGSPLQLDFGETGQDKFVLIVDAHPDSPARVRRVPLTAGRRLRTIAGTFEELAGQPHDEEDYLRVVVQEPPRVGLGEEVRELFPNAVEVVVAASTGPADDRGDWSVASLHRSPDELLGEYLAEVGSQDPQLRALFRELLEDAHAADAS